MPTYTERVGLHQQLTADTVDTIRLRDPYVRPMFATFDVTGGTQEDLWTTPTGHHLAVDDEVVFLCAGGGAAPFVAGTTYYVKDIAGNGTKFRLAATKGGAVIEGTSTDSTGAWRIVRKNDKWSGFTSLTHLVIGNITGSDTIYYTLDGQDPRVRQQGVAPGEFAIFPNSNPARPVKLWAPNSGTNAYLVAQVDPDIYAQPPFQYIQGAFNQTIPSGEYAPVHFEYVNDASNTSAIGHHDGFYTGRGHFEVITTVAAGSNGEALNNLTSDTLNVASTAGFPTPSATRPEYAVVYDVSDSFKCQVVQYTGLTATTLTGIGGAGLPTGSITVATNDAVAPAHINLMGNPAVSYGQDPHYLLQSVLQVIWENEATTPTTLDTIRRLRYDVNTNLGIATVRVPYWRSDLPGFDAPTPGLMHEIVAQPGGPPGTDAYGVLVAYQNSGADLEILGAIAGGPDATMSTQCAFADVRSPL